MQCNAIQCNAMQSLRFLAPVWVWAILRFRRWPRKPFFRTGQTDAVPSNAMQSLRFLAPVWVWAILRSSRSLRTGSIYSALAKRWPRCNCVFLLLCYFGHSPLQPLAAEIRIPHWPNGGRKARQGKARQSLCVPATRLVWAFLRSSRWLRTGGFRFVLGSIQ